MPYLDVEAAIAAAEQRLSQLVEHYPRHVASVLDEMERAAAGGNWESVRVMAHDIKGQAATVGWPILGAIAESLQRSLESDAAGLFTEATRLHIQSTRYCVGHRISQMGAEGDLLLADLRALTAAMRARQGAVIGPG